MPDAMAFHDVLPAAPTATRDFQQHSHATASVTVARSSSQVSPVKLTVHLLDGQGTTVVDASETLPAERFDASGLAPYRFEIPFDRLPPGWYLLTVAASATGRTTPQRDVTFRVR